jgi:hypothetical protein
MNISQLICKCKDIALNKLDMKSFYVGNTFDHSTSKGDSYPCLWFEMPVLTEYSIAGKHNKQFTFALSFLNLPKLDDLNDEINHISHMEEYADRFLQYMKQDPDFSLFQTPVGLSLKAINSDIACGIRIDIKVNTGRVCDPVTCDTEPPCCL